MNDSKDYLGFYWRERRQTSGDYLNNTIELLHGIRAVSDNSGDVHLLSQGKILKVDLDNHIEMKDEIINLFLDPEVAYINSSERDSNDCLTSPLGFTSHWEINSEADLSIAVTVSNGAHGNSSPGNSVVCKFGGSVLDRESSFKLTKAVWKYLISFCQPDFAAYTSHELSSQLDPEFEFNYSLGWMSFFNVQMQEKGLPKELEVKFYKKGCQLKVPDKAVGSLDSEVVGLLKVAQNICLKKGII